ncbi:MAG: A/G-specific adenine glycosylase [Rhizobiaceae bacterium]|nr:A/G-specific adenine glycosylase [Rhizobiaceae bacterium]
MNSSHRPIAPQAASDKASVSERLLDWYDRHHRELPWRVSPSQRAKGVAPDPYHVWLSEIMLQQTTVEAVKPYFQRFKERWPSVTDLAASDVDDVMKAWAGLGYYSRARNLKACANHIAANGGAFPETEAGLLQLPGVGPYTAAAIAAIAFNQPAAVVDGNVERVVSRLYAIDTPLPAAKVEIRQIVSEILPVDRPGDFAQAMMDLGATICSPKRPSCMVCPVNSNCAALANDDPERFPVKPPKMEKPLRRGAAFVAVRPADGAVLLRKRPDRGLLGGMAEPPTTSWNSRTDGETGVDAAPFVANWEFCGRISHVFTHFALELEVFSAQIEPEMLPDHYFWSSDVLSEALPTVMKKVIESALPGATKRGRFA